MNVIPFDAPAADVVEVSLIGPGYGESVIVHLGDGQWIIVDSCVNENFQGFPRSTALTYLNRIKVDFANNVSCVLATHWHNDHISGLSEVVDFCKSAIFCCAAAFSRREFLGFASRYAQADPAPNARSTREIVEVFELLLERGTEPKFLKSDTQVLSTKRGVEIFALSPSDGHIAHFLSLLAMNMPTLGNTKTKIRDIKPNEASVVLLIDLGNGDDKILLGADLEETTGHGWTSIVNNSVVVKEKKSSVYKVAHHGSRTGDCPSIWEELLLPKPFAILTPFSKGHSSLPTEEDVKRILKRTPNAYSSARLSSRRPKRRDASVEREARDGKWNLRRALPKQGHLRMRRRLGDPRSQWSVNLYGNAALLEDIRS